MENKIRVSAPGKIILSGEHAVVYGYPEVLCAINRRLTVEIQKSENALEVTPSEGELFVKYGLELIKTKLGISELGNLKIKIDSQIPLGCGLGSSAAFAVALTAGIFKFLKLPWSLKKINEIAYEIEKKQHGTPSGGDNTVCTYGGFLLYRKETEIFKVFSPLKAKIFPKVFLINSGKRLESTGEMIKAVKDFVLRSPQKTEKIFREMEKVTRSFLRYLSGEELNFGDLIKNNESFLEELMVVSEKTKNLIQKIEKIGGSAKISGAGGLKEGSGVILAYHQDPKILLKFTGEEKLEMFEVKLGERGVRSEQN